MSHRPNDHPTLPRPHRIKYNRFSFLALCNKCPDQYMFYTLLATRSDQIRSPHTNKGIYQRYPIRYQTKPLLPSSTRTVSPENTRIPLANLPLRCHFIIEKLYKSFRFVTVFPSNGYETHIKNRPRWRLFRWKGGGCSSPLKASSKFLWYIIYLDRNTVLTSPSGWTLRHSWAARFVSPHSFAP